MQKEEKNTIMAITKVAQPSQKPQKNLHMHATSMVLMDIK
jgi:hypothetical protein